jgi:hypothetical protein
MSPGLLFRATIPSLAWWIGAVITVTLAGYPGVVCMTPMAWLLAIPAGFTYARLARAQRIQAPLVGAAAAGALLGLAYGITFLFVSQRMTVQPDEVGRAQVLTAGIAVVGMIVGALLSAGAAAIVINRGR